MGRHLANFDAETERDIATMGIPEVAERYRYERRKKIACLPVDCLPRKPREVAARWPAEAVARLTPQT